MDQGHEPTLADDRKRAVALQIDHLSKTFPGTRALDDVSVTVDYGEVLALLGPNGSGKSTLIKVLSGLHRPDGGADGRIAGESFTLGDAVEAYRHGLRFVHQDLALVLELNAVDNIALTTGYLRRGGAIDEGAQLKHTEELLSRFAVDIDPLRPLIEASPVERTCVAIARALWDWHQGPRVLVLDEPTASLPSREVTRLFEVVREVREAGHAVIYVSHRMDEIFAIADRATVLRAGRVVATGKLSEFTHDSLVTAIAGREVEAAPPSLGGAASEESVLVVNDLRGRYLRGVDLAVRGGEIVGIAGLLGSGRDELPYALAGAVPTKCAGGAWSVAGESVKPPANPADAMRLGIHFVPAERAREGLIAQFSVAENVTFDGLAAIGGSRWFLRRRTEMTRAREALREVGVDEGTAARAVTSLSGGNQQRVLFGRALSSDPTVLVLAEPTAGVDVGARQGVYDLLRDRVKSGTGVVVCSSDTEDLVSICDRVVVIRDGRVCAEMVGSDIDAEAIVASTEGPDVTGS
jgi:ribose transport system ATP-binding protein